jgi:hypothetical protein
MEWRAETTPPVACPLLSHSRLLVGAGNGAFHIITDIPVELNARLSLLLDHRQEPFPKDGLAPVLEEARRSAPAAMALAVRSALWHVSTEPPPGY